MKKAIIFSIFFITFLIINVGSAQAETKEFYIPFEDTEETLGDFIKNNIFNRALGASKTITANPGDQVSGDIEDYNPVGAASDYFFSFGQIKDKSQCVYDVLNDPTFRQMPCDDLAIKEDESIFSFFPNFIKKAEARPLDCWKPVCTNKNPPYQIIKAELITNGLTATDYTLPRDNQKCEMDIHIVGASVGCNNVWAPGSQGQHFLSDGGVCVYNIGGSNKYTLEHNDPSIAASRACAHVRLDANAGANQYVVKWTGTVKITGRLGSFDDFYVVGEDYYTKKDRKVHENEALEICKGKKVAVTWASSDVSETNLWVGVGNSEPKIFSSGEKKTINYTPNDTTTFFVEVKAVTGDGPKSIISGPISVIPMDCSGGPSPWVSIGANPNTINPGESSTLTWTSGNVTSCQAVGNASDWTGGKTKNGNATVTPSSTRWYEIKCTDGTTEVRDDAKVKVNGPPAGSLNVKIFLDGVEITNATDVSFDLLGSETINVSEAPKTISDVPAGTYNLGSVSGGPEESTFLNFTPTPTITVLANQTANLSLYFTSDQGRCNITVQATKYSCDATSSSPWTGALSYGLIGPIILNGTAVDQTFENIPAGRYYLTSLVGGPGIYNGVTPGNPISCPSGGNVTVMMKFKDCGDTTSYKCNYSTGRCDLCSTSSEECKYNDLPACNVQCSGCVGPHIPKANIFCWANFDSDKCVGVNDNNDTTPSIILYDKSTDSCGDPRTCTWEIYEPTVSSGNMIKTIKTCAPYPWYDEKPGKYEAKLIVEDTKSSSFDIQPFEIKNVDALTCNFAWDPDAPTVSGTTGFFDQTLTPSGTTLKSWKWTFEGATPASSTAQTVSKVVFNSAGVKNVTLTVKNSADKTCTISKEITVKTINPYWKEVIPF
jgi:hypothetical protein